MTDFFHVGELILRPQLTDDLNDVMSASDAHMTVTNTWMNTHTELEFPTVPVVWFTTALCEDNGKTIVQKLWVVEQMDCGRAGLVQDDIRARMKEDESLVDLMAPMTSTVVSMVASMGASMVAPMAPLVASMASVASMVEALDWLKWVTAESKSDDERVDGWTPKFREEQIDGLTMKIDGKRADGLTHKIRGELTVGLILLDGLVQVVTWARTKRVESSLDSTALMTRIASTVALMVASMVATMVALVASSRSKETTTARGDREGIETREAPGQDPGECRAGESSQEDAEQACQLEVNCKRRKSRICSHKILPRPLLNLSRTGGVNPIRETWNVDLTKETGKCPEETEKRERLTRSVHSRCFENIASKCLEQLVRSLSLMCWNMDFPEGLLCSLTVLILKVKNELMGCLTKFVKNELMG